MSDGFFFNNNYIKQIDEIGSIYLLFNIGEIFTLITNLYILNAGGTSPGDPSSVVTVYLLTTSLTICFIPCLYLN